MIRWRFQAPLIGAALAGCLVAAGCSTGGTSSAAPGNLEKTNLVVEAVPALDSAAVYIAEQRGLFAAEGLHVTVLPAISSKTVIQQQEAGKFDVSVGNYVSYILADAAQSPKSPTSLQIIAPGSVMQPGTQEIVVPAGSPIQTISQLQGKTIGVNVSGNIGTLLVESVLADSAITNPTQAVHFKAIPFPEMAVALKRHQVDAAWLPEPFITQAEEVAGAVPLADADQGASQGIPITGYVVTKAWAKKYPHTLAAFRAAIMKAQSIAATDPGAVQSGMHQFAGTPARDAAIAVAPQYPTANSQALIGRLASLMLAFGMLNQKFNVSSMFQAG